MAKRRTKAEIEYELEMANGCLIMVAEILENTGCRHGHGHGSTPAMFYPEWIACVLQHHVRLARLESVGGRVPQQITA